MNHKRYGARPSEIEAYMTGKYVNNTRVLRKLNSIEATLELLFRKRGHHGS